MTMLTIQLAEPFITKLDLLAGEKGSSIEKVAAEILSDSLDQKELLMIRLEIAKLRDDLAVATHALIAAQGKVSPERATEWVKKNLLDH